MPIETELKLEPEKAYDRACIREEIAGIMGWQKDSEFDFHILRRSLDARRKPVFILKVKIYEAGEVPDSAVRGFQAAPSLERKKRILIVGFGPAGMFAALQLLERGFTPCIVERGKTVRERRRDLARLNRELLVNPESNYCFGEGGAGTYSDGKLYTRSKKRGNVLKVLQTFADHGASPDILVDAHPHIGTNKLPGIVENIRETILKAGGIIRFETRLTGLTVGGDRITEVELNGREKIPVDAVILATGHSARDVFYLLHDCHIRIEAKPFALGVRVEHPQSLIDSIQYGSGERSPYLPPASYSLVTQAGGRGVFSFCMCPGGIIAPAATAPGEIVVNGWSPSKRDGKFANSGMVVSINPPDWIRSYGDSPLSALHLQQEVERSAFAVNRSIAAPAQRIEDFLRGKVSVSLPECSYLPGVSSADLRSILPGFVAGALKTGLTTFGKSMKGYTLHDALMVGVESRTSSPVRIPRDKETLRHPQIRNLLPCGEGAGYAGGIVSAALDGMACAEACLTE